MAESRKELEALIGELSVAPEKLVLMGFSQGAMMAVDASLRLREICAGVAILSGTLVDRRNLSALAPSKKGMPFFQSHGSVDPILGFAQALELEKELKAAGWEGELHRFEGGHAIPPEIIAGLGAWLRAL
jgi:phospholipase/carboxylesterase